MTKEKSSKNNRVLDIYTCLSEGRIVNKSQKAKKFGVDERSIQRDIDDVRSFLDERRTERASDGRKVKYDRSCKGFVMTGQRVQ